MKIEMDFCTLKFYDNYVICFVHENENVTIQKSNDQTKVILDYFKKKPFVYITHRINQYTVDPNIYVDSSKIETLLGFVVVSKDILAVKNALSERPHLSKPFEIFEEIEDAILWAENVIELNKGTPLNSGKCSIPLIFSARPTCPIIKIPKPTYLLKIIVI